MNYISSYKIIYFKNIEVLISNRYSNVIYKILFIYLIIKMKNEYVIFKDRLSPKVIKIETYNHQ